MHRFLSPSSKSNSLKKFMPRSSYHHSNLLHTHFTNSKTSTYLSKSTLKHSSSTYQLQTPNRYSSFLHLNGNSSFLGSQLGINRSFSSGYWSSCGILKKHDINGSGFLTVKSFISDLRSFSSEPDRESIEYHVVIVGTGPTGLSAAIRLKQMCCEKDIDLSVCVVEKGAEVGAHILSGNVFEPRALNELLPQRKEEDVLFLFFILPVVRMGNRQFMKRRWNEPSELLMLPKIIKKYKLREKGSAQHQTYGLGIKEGEGRGALKLFEEMNKFQIKPDDVTMVVVLSAYSHCGIVFEGEMVFKEMHSVYGIIPRLERFDCIVDLYGRAGLLSKAKEIISRMP
ncbi:PPR domain-containing protein/NAD_binding_8 domain-containing protein [Cephalotus follicularis]|uniref:Electron transfer flavoprotein-ubiquinone oxidoreductase n=1 Tax=Cephalotus follicularis TaxID=3775 RepID=A0A1Q3AV35_CEPFO|nr:PPR domain-containing protein/NAD_binding_8 domain-containing protein [Cephalotus follicularis]